MLCSEHAVLGVRRLLSVTQCCHQKGLKGRAPGYNRKRMDLGSDTPHLLDGVTLEPQFDCLENGDYIIVHLTEWL